MNQVSWGKTIEQLGSFSEGFTPLKWAINKIVVESCSVYNTKHIRLRGLKDFSFVDVVMDGDDDELVNDDVLLTDKPSACVTL